MNNKAKTGKAAGSVIALTAGLVGTTIFVGQLAAETPDSTAVERQESAPSAHHYTGPRTADAAEHWIRWSNRNEDRIVRHHKHRIISGEVSMQGFEAIARTRVASGDWSQDMVDRIVYAARVETLARLHQGCGVYSAGRFVELPVGC